jgi:hypothetical protein
VQKEKDRKYNNDHPKARVEVRLPYHSTDSHRLKALAMDDGIDRWDFHG